MLGKVFEQLNRVSPWKHEEMESVMRQVGEESGWKVGEVFMMLRVAVTARTATPPLFETMEVLGKEVSLKRVSQALEILS